MARPAPRTCAETQPMDKKLILCAAGVLAGITFFLATGVRMAENAATANRRVFSSRADASAGQERIRSRDRDVALLDDLRAVARSGDEFDREKFASLLGKLLAADPAAAAAFAESIPAGPIREEALRRVSGGWAAENPAGAETWVAGLTDEGERMLALSEICTSVAHSDGSGAIAIVGRNGLAGDMVADSIVHRWAEQDFLAAATWVKGQPAGGRREEMVMRLAIVQSATDPAEAARLVVAEIPDGQVQTEAVISVIYQWACRDMAGAREWVRLFPESELRTRAEIELSNITAYQVPVKR